jgi:hypothetical protein
MITKKLEGNKNVLMGLKNMSKGFEERFLKVVVGKFVFFEEFHCQLSKRIHSVHGKFKVSINQINIFYYDIMLPK